jgi:hypothetical protein
VTHFFSHSQATKAGFGIKFILVAVLIMAFCPGCKRSAAENANDADWKKSHGGEEIAFKYGTGAEGHYAGGTAPVILPPGFPNDVPLYPKAIPTQTQTTPPPVCVLLNTSDSAAKVKAFYLEKMKENGWKIKIAATATDTMLEGVKEDRKLTVLISKKSGGTQFSLTIAEEK